MKECELDDCTAVWREGFPALAASGDNRCLNDTARREFAVAGDILDVCSHPPEWKALLQAQPVTPGTA